MGILFLIPLLSFDRQAERGYSPKSACPARDGCLPGPLVARRCLPGGEGYRGACPTTLSKGAARAWSEGAGSKILVALWNEEWGHRPVIALNANE